MISKAFYVAAMSVRAGRTCPSDVCRRLPSDPVSRRTPLPLAVSFPLLGQIRDFHPLETCAARRTIMKGLSILDSPFVFVLFTFLQNPCLQRSHDFTLCSIKQFILCRNRNSLWLTRIVLDEEIFCVITFSDCY